MGHIIGLDLGTSAVKAILIDEKQHVIASASSSLSVSRPNAGWSEQNPVDWISAATNAIDQIKQSDPAALSVISGIGLSGQMHGATLLGDFDRVLRPAVLWNDTRSYQQAATLDADPHFRQITGNIVFPGFTAPKIAWVRAHEPEVYRSLRSVLLPKDYLRLWLTGEKITDMSDASGTSWLDVGKRQWSELLLDRTGLTIDAMPTLAEGTDQAGQLRTELAQRWGINNTVIVAGGAGDNAASACGLGVIGEGSAFVSLGTSGVLFASSDQYRPAPESAVHSFCHAFANGWHQMGVILSATDSLNWYADLVGLDPATLTQELGDTAITPDGVTFLPYLSGERTPHNESRPMGAFIGLSHRHDRISMTRAVLLGVAFALRDNLEALKSTGANIESVVAIGGGSLSNAWLQTVASALQLPVHCPADGAEGAALGAARLGLVATHGLSIEQVCKPPEIARTFEPFLPGQDAFADGYSEYRRLYPALAELSQ
ncbi:MAG: xylulokinase [Burkholderiaceae bacterium]